MNGGYVLIVRLSDSALHEALARVAGHARLTLALLDEGECERADAERRLGVRRLVFGVEHRGGTRYVLPCDPEDERALRAVGDALARELSAPLAMILDTDAGSAPIAQWNGGRRPNARQGQRHFSSHYMDWGFEFQAPPFTAMPSHDAQSLLDACTARAPPSCREVGVRFIAVARRELGSEGLAGLLDDLQVSVAVGAQPLQVTARGPSEQAVCDAVIAAVLDRLSRWDFPQEVRDRHSAVPEALVQAVRAHLAPEIALQTLVRRGPPRFLEGGFEVLDAEVECAGVVRPLCVAVCPEPVKIAQALRTELERAVKQQREAKEAEGRLRYQQAILDGELDTAARLYVALYFANVDDQAKALAAAHLKVAELAKLFRR